MTRSRSRSHSRARSSRRRSLSRARRRKHRYRSSDRSHKASRRRSRYSRSSSRSSDRTTRSSHDSSASTSRSPSRSPIRSGKTSASNASLAPGKIRLQKTPSPPPAPAFSAAMDYLDGRQVCDALDELNADEFVPKTFKTDQSGKPKVTTSAATKVARNYAAVPSEDPLFHQNVSGNLGRGGGDMAPISWLRFVSVLCGRRGANGALGEEAVQLQTEAICGR